MKTIIYVCCSLLIIAAGVIVILTAQGNTAAESVGASLIAGGVASLAFCVIRYFDDLHMDSAVLRVLDSFRQLQNSLNDLGMQIAALQTHALVRNDHELHCVFKRHVSNEFQDAVKAVPKRSHLYVNVMGFSLYRFYVEQLPALLARRGATVRLLVQDPAAPTFVLMAEQEGRDRLVMMKEVLEVTRAVLQSNASATPVAALADQQAAERDINSVELRWFPYAASVTLVRVNDIVFTRSRFLGEGRDAPVFFERYHGDASASTRAYIEYFEQAWRQSRNPTDAECSELAERIGKDSCT